MAIKKKAKAKKALPKEKPMGFFERNKDILPVQQPVQKSVRVKTFIVEKPIIIHDKPQHINSSNDEEENAAFGENKKYKKKFRGVDLEEAQDESDDAGADAGDDDLGEDFDSAAEGEFEEGAEGSEEAAEGDVGAMEQQVKMRHARSHGMITNVWWKKAVLWGFLVWLIILVFEVVLWTVGLISEINFTRQWWIFLGGLIVVAMIYFGVIENRFKI